MEEYDYLQSGHRYRLLPEAKVQLSTLDGNKTYEAVGPGEIFLESSGLVLLDRRALIPKDQSSLLHKVTAGGVPSTEIAGVSLRRLQVVPDEEKRSSIHEVDAYAYLGEQTTPQQARTEALSIAKRQALEMARVHIEANSLVKDGKLKYDIIKSGAKGLFPFWNKRTLDLKATGIMCGSRQR